jgi:hypothetical protein
VSLTSVSVKSGAGGTGLTARERGADEVAAFLGDISGILIIAEAASGVLRRRELSEGGAAAQGGLLLFTLAVEEAASEQGRGSEWEGGELGAASNGEQEAGRERVHGEGSGVGGEDLALRSA